MSLTPTNKTDRRTPLRIALTTMLFALTVASSAHAQGGSDGSLYSRFGIGDLQSFGSPQIVAMGGGATGLGGARYANFSNPATLAGQFLTGVAAGLAYTSVDITDRFDNTSRLSNGSLSAIQFSFPVKPNKMGIGASFAPYSTRKYRIQFRDELETSTGDMIPYSVDFLGSGGLQKATLGTGLGLSRNISVGLEGQLLFGLLEESQETSFDDATYETSILTNSVRMLGITARAGILATLPNVRAEGDQLSIGFQITLPTSLSAKQTKTAGPAQERDTLSVGADGDIELPLSTSLGVAYRASPRWLFVADFRYEPWTDFSSTFVLPGYDPADPSGLSDRTRVSGGFEVVPAGSDLLAKYFRRVGYRLGFFYDPVYLSSDVNTKVNTIAVTGGLSLPTRLPGTRIDLNIEAGTRGTIDMGLVRERFFRFGVNLNVGERWFVKTRLG